MIKREPPARIDDIAAKFRRVELGPLRGRLAGASLIASEHCLVEILGDLFEQQRFYLDGIGEAEAACIDAGSRPEFVRAHADYNEQKYLYLADNAKFSPVGRYFQQLYERLSDLEEQQERAQRPVTVVHARRLSALIVQQLDTMCTTAQYRNHRLAQCINRWLPGQECAA